MIYLIGSLRNPKVPEIATSMRDAGLEVFDDWYAAGPTADDSWKDYEVERGRTYLEALSGAAATNVFQFDKRHLDDAEAVVLVAPAGKSGHLELGYALGRGRPGYYLLDTPDRWDVMLKFATLVTTDLQEIIDDVQQRLYVNMGQQILNPRRPRLDVVKGPLDQDRRCDCWFGQERGECGV